MLDTFARGDRFTSPTGRRESNTWQVRCLLATVFGRRPLAEGEERLRGLDWSVRYWPSRSCDCSSATLRCVRLDRNVVVIVLLLVIGGAGDGQTERRARQSPAWAMTAPGPNGRFSKNLVQARPTARTAH
jgi:hypothetical protein